MSHIPFIIWTSGKFQTDYSQTWRTLLEHQDAYWTNDLTYELMIDLMGIKGAPDDEKSLDIAHPLYNRTKENTFTLHKKKSLFEEK
jgi:heptose-I-phosphate ethanolaminephosphotransferase